MKRGFKIMKWRGRDTWLYSSLFCVDGTLIVLKPKHLGRCAYLFIYLFLIVTASELSGHTYSHVHSFIQDLPSSSFLFQPCITPLHCYLLIKLLGFEREILSIGDASGKLNAVEWSSLLLLCHYSPNEHCYWKSANKKTGVCVYHCIYLHWDLTETVYHYQLCLYWC